MLPRAFRKAACLALGLAVFAPAPALALDIELDGNLVLEQRHYPHAGRTPTLEQNFTSLSGEIELGFYSRSGRHAVIVTPFGRADQHDHERSHVDLREAKYRYVNGDWELTIGADKVFWGVTEFLHLVDIINQTDNVESIDGEQKLGQPMIRAAYASPYGTLTGFYLPYFRIRQYPDPQTGRPSIGVVVDDDTTLFENADERKSKDYALRYSHSIGAVDFGLSWFDGTARDPVFVPIDDSYQGLPIVRAKYELLQQSGLDVQATLGSWLVKLEATRATQNDLKTERATGGIEYTFYNLFGSGTDLGLVAEYMWDERGTNAPHPFADDIGIGFRWTANNPQSTTILLGGIMDTKTDSTAISLEAERRIGQDFKLSVEARFQDNVGDDDALTDVIRDEDLVRLQFSWYF